MAGSSGSSESKSVAAKYVGTSDVRTIDAKSFKKNGVTDQDDVSWSKENDFTVKVSKTAAEFLGTQSDFEVK